MLLLVETVILKCYFLVEVGFKPGGDVAGDVFFYQGPVFPKVHSAIHGINHYPLDSAIGFPKCTCIMHLLQIKFDLRLILI